MNNCVISSKTLFYLALALLLLFTGSCNLYSPLASEGTDRDLVDAANKCLAASDYACALQKYEKLSDANLRGQKICLLRLTQGGISINTLVNIIRAGEATMLGKLAQTLVPWSAAKSEALDLARTACVDFADAEPTVERKTKTLLKSLALMSHCAIRMARTDLYVASSDADTSCTTAGNQNGQITQADIGSGSLGRAVGMCSSDVDACGEDIVDLPDDADLRVAGLDDFQQAYESIPAALTLESTATSVRRTQLQNTVAP